MSSVPISAGTEQVRNIPDDFGRRPGRMHFIVIAVLIVSDNRRGLAFIGLQPLFDDFGKIVRTTDKAFAIQVALGGSTMARM